MTTQPLYELMRNAYGKCPTIGVTAAGVPYAAMLSRGRIHTAIGEWNVPGFYHDGKSPEGFFFGTVDDDPADLLRGLVDAMTEVQA